VAFRHVRLLLDGDRASDAEEVLRSVELDPRDWRPHWYRGLVHLRGGSPEAAITEFRTVYEAAPGEIAPKLALGFACEAALDPADAAVWYEVVARTDPAFTSACFGLARCRRLTGDLDAAIQAYDLVPESSSAYEAAQADKAELLLSGDDAAIPPSTLLAASSAIEQLPPGSDARLTLTTRALEAALVLLAHDGTVPGAGTILGHPLTETELRFTLEHTYRALAKRATSVSKRIELVDRANHVRPTTLT
jgi:serine/threonine-protein kinase PknG